MQVLWREALLLHPPDTITVDMARWRGHFGTLMPFYAACEKAGGFTGKAQRVLGVPEEVRGGLSGQAASVLRACGAGTVAELDLYRPFVRSDGSVCDWGKPIRCAALPCTPSLVRSYISWSPPQ
jgi:hypothetical protein